MSNATPLMTADDVARRLNVHVETVRRWTRNGRLPVVRVSSKRNRYRAEDVETLIADGFKATA